MFIPLGTDRPRKRRPVVTPVIVGLTIFAHLVFVIVAASDESLGRRIQELFWIHGRDFRWWGLFTSALLHGGLLHLLGNMLFLWVFGPPVEDRVGRIGFVAIYLASAAASAGAHAAFESAPAIGASGAVAGVTGMFFVLFPRTRIRCFVFFLIIGVFMIPAWWFIGFKIAMDLIAQGFGGGEGVANLAHLAGYGFGIGVSLALLKTGILSREPYDLFSISRHANRRRAFKAAAGRPEAAPRPALAVERPDPRQEALAVARGTVSTRVAEGDLDGAVEAYRRLEREFDDVRGAALLSRDAQYQVANQLVRQGDHRGAARAYERMLEAYPDDREATEVRIMLGRLRGRYLGERDRALDILRSAARETEREDLRALAHEEIEAISEGETA